MYRDHKRVMVLENYVLLATKQKSNIDKAMQSFIDMLEEDGDYLPAVLGMATGFMIEKTQVCYYNIFIDNYVVAQSEKFTKASGEDGDEGSGWGGF